MKNRNKKVSKLPFLLLLLTFTIAMLSTSTFAWFTANRVVTIRTINVHVAASGGVEISADGSNWKAIILPEDLMTVHSTTYPTSVNQIPSEMKPVSTGKQIDGSNGFLKMYYGVADNNDDGEYILTSERIIEQEGNGETNEGKFVSFDIFFKVANDTDIYMTNNSKVTYLDEEGKGIAAASLGLILKSRGLKVVNQKFDPYLNIDPGTMNPIQHGEVFVTDDGAETDLDLGHYERFTDATLSQSSNTTAGRVYLSVLNNEREGNITAEPFR